MSFIAIIPARASSTRLPDKPLLDIGGKPMVIRTAEQAARSNAIQVVIATDDIRIHDVVREHGFTSLLTRADHPTGTDRLSEAAAQLGLAPDAIVVNVQGDEPLINPEHINAVAALLLAHPQASIATCACPLTDAQALFNPNVVKVVCNQQQHALYFSRAPIPWARDALAQGERVLAGGLPALHHIGLYAYRASFLAQFPKLPSGPLEHFESLEQLRALENGHQIAVQTMTSPPAAGVDTTEDLIRVRDLFLNRL
ncbi:3-deoxy-manno-octulosonate cytidylyltransferase [Alcaligenaceae bacterium]|nr:3-deoxy-manno-octulosonate cytidylyltransferase [Alcaligenaceae bacterium]